MSDYAKTEREDFLRDRENGGKPKQRIGLDGWAI